MHMLIIGILAPQHALPMIKLLKRIFSKSGKRCMTFTADNVRCEYILQLKNTDIDFAVVDIDGEISGELFFDVLIFDNTAGYADKKSIEKCITASTKIIYNTDVNYTEFNCKCDKIGYGLSVRADVTASSVVRNDEDTEIVYCVQKSISTVYNKVIEMSEIVIRLADEPLNIHHALAAVTCAAVCEVE